MATSINKYTDDFLEKAHKGSLCHKAELLAGNICGCFYCEETFPPAEIEEWIEEPDNRGETALCPKCAIDSVLGSKYPVTDKSFLKAMNYFWFS